MSNLHIIKISETLHVSDCNEDQLVFLKKFGAEAAPFRGWIAEYYGPKNSDSKPLWIEMVKELEELQKGEDRESTAIFEEHLRKSFLCFEPKGNIYLGDKELVNLVTLKLPYEYVGKASVDVDAPGMEIYEKISSLSEKFLSGLEKANSIAFNVHCNSPKVDSGLLMINQVLLKEDCCTDRLQELLDDGWRIVSVCPQPDQRRPDYILGRYNKEI